MSETAASERYRVRDPHGNVYGPADVALLRAWVREGRVIPGMWIAALDTETWVEASVHPAVADLLLAAAPSISAASPPTLQSSPQPSMAQGDHANPPAPPRDEMVLQRAAKRIGVDPAVLRNLPRPGDPDMVTYAPPPTHNILGIVGFILGLVGVLLEVCSFCIATPVAGLLAVTAIVLGSVALWQINVNPAAYRGKGFAVAGICCGGALLLIVLCVVAWFIYNLVNSPP